MIAARQIARAPMVAPTSLTVGPGEFVALLVSECHKCIEFYDRSMEEFNQFVETDVATRWKEGFTIVEANGVWLSEQRHITEHEPSRILIRFHDGSAAASADIEAIRNAYIKQFTQDAVLRTDRATCADF